MGGCHEITLSEMMSDPIVLMVMQADGVDPYEFELNLRAANRRHDAWLDADEASRRAVPRRWRQCVASE